ncbi:MAG: hypothetical protein ACSLE6_20800 [Mycobacterium sp.]
MKALRMLRSGMPPGWPGVGRGADAPLPATDVVALAEGLGAKAG